MVPYKHRNLLILIAENHNCNRIRTHNDLFLKKCSTILQRWLAWLNCWVLVYKGLDSRFESRCGHFYLKYRAYS